MLRPLNVLPLGDHISPWCLSCSITPDNIFCIAAATSDGQVNLVSTALSHVLNAPGKGDPATFSRGLSVTQIEYAREEVKVGEQKVAESEEGKHQQQQEQEQQQHQQQQQQDNKISPEILFSSGYPLEFCNAKPQALVKKRIKLDTRTQTPAQLSLDDWTAVLKVKFNLNFHFPRWVASGGLSGIVRCQPVTDI